MSQRNNRKEDDFAKEIPDDVAPSRLLTGQVSFHLGAVAAYSNKSYPSTARIIPEDDDDMQPRRSKGRDTMAKTLEQTRYYSERAKKVPSKVCDNATLARTISLPSTIFGSVANKSSKILSRNIEFVEPPPSRTPTLLPESTLIQRHSILQTTTQNVLPGAVAVYSFGRPVHDDTLEEDSTEYVQPLSAPQNGVDYDNESGSPHDFHGVETAPVVTISDGSIMTTKDGTTFWRKHWKIMVAFFILAGIVIGTATPLAFQARSETSAPLPVNNSNLPPTEPLKSLSSSPSASPSASPSESLAPTVLMVSFAPDIFTGGTEAAQISISQFGNIIAVTSEGFITVYRLDENQWIDMGTPFEGVEAHLSLDGSTIVVRQESAKEVSVYTFNSSTLVWNQLGQAIQADFIVNATALSGNGNVVVVGDQHYTVAYELNSYGEWQGIGERYFETDSAAITISTSADGKVIGATHGSDSDSQPEPFATLWVLSETSGLDEFPVLKNLLGSQVSVSSDGTSVAIGSVGIWQWSFLIDVDEIHIQPFVNGNSDVRVSLSGDGKTLASLSTYLSVWRYTEAHSTKIGTIELDDPGGSLSLSADGNVVAVGMAGFNPRVQFYQIGSL